jgi:hypothetical protein
MCEKHKDTPCASHERVEAKSRAQDNEIKATPHGDSTGDGTLPKEGDNRDHESNARVEEIKIQDIKKFLDSAFNFNRRLEEEIMKIRMVDGRLLWFKQTEYADL